MNVNKIKTKCNNEEQKYENLIKSDKKEQIINELKENSVNMEDINNKEKTDKKIDFITNNNDKDLKQENKKNKII